MAAPSLLLLTDRGGLLLTSGSPDFLLLAPGAVQTISDVVVLPPPATSPFDRVPGLPYLSGRVMPVGTLAAPFRPGSA